MKLISESQYEDMVVSGLTALLCDLGIDADGYTEQEALALTYISPEDFSIECGSLHMTKEDQLAFLKSVEDNVRTAMLTAGYEAVQKAMLHARGGKVRLTRSIG